ncbi:acyl-CoA thioesterase [Mycolicibacterium parafortuitum]|uniref:Acyl-CoA thioesterase n=1 Tax=Mycolicibacterium parafortuitum TaxID=39692 RepID=A0A375YN63_MYCPF|nr:thioesterase family protein [Mycolicibacterium parafortuitum]ORB26208.1 acyl-CoA thioesterase [Mycolicibacterium parafortuitum]BBY76914.1 acyl-CoA thioesterase [Mycolicibacterium parafortuitum]SRX82588.1 acyl-CoA thioesterase [Saccharomonospora viridis DSM] [Mycolicibacterium parafortuitum]
MATHPFDEALELSPGDAGTLTGKTSPDWANMVGPFGGMTAATLLRAVEVQPERLGHPVALTVNFTAPVADGAFDVRATAVRTNRSNQHWSVELSQDGEIKTTATAVFGHRRDTWADIERQRPPAPGPEEVPAEGLPEAIVWARNYDMRHVDGAPPLDGQPRPSSASTLWVRDSRGRAMDYAALTAFSDIFYPRVYRRLGAPLPAGTISMTAYFHADAPEIASVGDDFILGRAQANRFAGGYFDQSAELWSRSGDLLATTHQLVYFKT